MWIPKGFHVANAMVKPKKLYTGQMFRRIDRIHSICNRPYFFRFRCPEGKPAIHFNNESGISDDPRLIILGLNSLIIQFKFPVSVDKQNNFFYEQRMGDYRLTTVAVYTCLRSTWKSFTDPAAKMAIDQ